TSYPENSPENINKPDDRCYIIYTSGSTGNPKGVQISHKNVIRLLFNEENLFDFSASDCWTLFHSYCFDFSVWEMYGALLYGGKLVIVSPETARDTNAFAMLCEKEAVTVLNQTPGAFYNFIESAESAKLDLKQLRYVIFGGEALHPKRLETWYENHPATKLVNMYGITETTVHVTYKEIGKQEISEGISNIGKAIPTLNCYVLDDFLHVQPVGVVGELCVSGDGLSRAYLNRPELTSERFADHPYIKGEKLYRSGDLARWLPNGELEYLGRKDQQVKIRGYRIEIGEIEKTLDSYPNIANVVVLARQDHAGENYLCAYYESETAIEAANLRTHLLRTLPDYMVPSFFVHLERIPLTSNGKVNRKALPDPQVGERSQANYVAPRNETESQLAAIWQEVLGIEQVGVQDNFFELGGHSLKATQVIALIRHRMQTDLSLMDFLKEPVIEIIAGKLSKAEAVEEIHSDKNRREFPLTASQKRIYIIEQFNNVGTTYNMPALIKVNGNLSDEKLTEAFNQLIVRQQILRTNFRFEHNEPIQFVREELVMQIQKVHIDESQLTFEYDNFVRPFDLENDSLIRMKSVRTDSGNQYLMFDVHHIISDGVSMEILITELLGLYQGKELNDLSISYGDFAAWQQKQLESNPDNKQRTYWREEFSEQAPILDLHTDKPRPKIKTFNGDRLRFQLPKETLDQLDNILKNNQVTHFQFFLACFKVLLAKYSGQQTLVVGTPVSGRTNAQSFDLIGNFINTIAIKTELNISGSFEDYLTQLAAKVNAAIENQDFPFEELVDSLNLERDLSRHPLFDVVYTHNVVERPIWLVDEILLEPLESESTTTKFDLTLASVGNTERMDFILEYNSDLFAASTIEGLTKHFVRVIEQVTKNLDVALNEIDLLSAEATKLLAEFNQTERSYDLEQSVTERIDGYAVSSPDSIALSDQSGEITYNELKTTTDAIAATFLENGVKQTDVVAIALDNSNRYVQAILGVLKSGAAYLPIDLNYPPDRIRYMLEDANCSMLLTDRVLDETITPQVRVLDIEKCIDSEKKLDHTSRFSSANRAYIIYTSGSSGRPKGVAVSHKALNNLTQWHVDEYQYSGETRAAKYAGVGFDASVWEIFPVLEAGGALHIVPDNIRLQIDKIADFVNARQIDSMFLPTAMAEEFSRYAAEQETCLRQLHTGGDKLRHYEQNSFRLYNSYGPTENAVVATTFEVKEQQANIPIGKPIANNRIFIVDPQLRLQALGVPGQIALSGASLAEGYINNPQETAARFVENPFLKGAKMYLTGDKGRWLPDGNIEFLGRIDDQVSIRGYRVELQEIEQVLKSALKAGKVLVKGIKDTEGDFRVIAWIAGEAGADPDQLKMVAAAKLPAYMIPSEILLLPEFKLTPNGKVDEKHLLSLVHEKQNTTRELVAPVNDTQRFLLTSWKEILATDQISITDNFFELGGNSMKIVKLYRTVNEAYPGKIQISDLFDKPTIESLAACMETVETASENFNVIDF
ncbi:MAG: hypothetical protein K0R65_1, partial [Crocinitomicaceae bacterium]|nr:hypothetical protein [Crocinitomicaceae bacterium]